MNSWLRSAITLILMVIIFYHHSPITVNIIFSYKLEAVEEKPCTNTVCPADITHFSLDTRSILLARSAVNDKNRWQTDYASKTVDSQAAVKIDITRAFWIVNGNVLCLSLVACLGSNTAWRVDIPNKEGSLWRVFNPSLTTIKNVNG
jgi:hypothetical protein